MEVTPAPKTVNCVLMDGGVGDHVGGSLIAVDYILKTYPWMTILLWLPDFLLDFAENVLEHHGDRIVVNDYTSMPKLYDPEMTTINTKWDGRVSPMKRHVADYAFSVLCDEEVPVEEKNSLKVNLNPVKTSHLNLPKRYVVLLTGYTAAVREFFPATVNALADYVKTRGYVPVFLGQTDTKTGTRHVIQGSFSEAVDLSKGLNLINRTTLLQAAKVMHNSKVVVGVDCGLMHVAGCTDATIVGGYTTVSPKLRAPIRHNQLGWNWYPVEPDQDLSCRFCQVRTNFLYGHDYRNCLHDNLLCVKQLTPEKFIAHLKDIL